MSDARSDAEIRRLRAALILLLVGAALIVWVWAHWMYRSASISATQTVQRVEHAIPHETKVKAARNLSMLLLAGFFLVVLVLFGSLLIVRAGRRYREKLLRPRPNASTSTDIWSQHKPRAIDYEEDEPLDDESSGDQGHTT